MNDQPQHDNEESAGTPRYETDEHAEKRFRGWHLIGWIMVVVAVLALVSALVDWMVIGPLEGRVF